MGGRDRGDAQDAGHGAAKLGPLAQLADPALACFRAEAPVADGRRLALVLGNCQAESLRICLDGTDLATVRLPPVHELTAADLGPLFRWLARAEVLVTQPIRDDYRGLPVGTRQLAARLRPTGRTLVWPVVRFAGLYPTHAIIRPPHDRSLVPPLVAYHDLEVLAEAAAFRGGRRRPRARLDGAAVRGIGALSLEQLRRREEQHGAVPVSDLFARPSFAHMRTLNHAGNAIWVPLAARVRARLGLVAAERDPGRPLLNAVHAPRRPEVIEAYGLSEAPRAAWQVDGRDVTVEAVREAHLAFYSRHPAVIDAGLERHRDALGVLGLT